MKYLILKEANGDLSITTPVPPNHIKHNGDSLIIDKIPKLKKGFKFNLVGGKLVTEKKTVTDVNKDKLKQNQIDFKTIDDEITTTIMDGFSFDSHQFSLTVPAQLNWQNLFMLKQANLFSDTEISTLESSVYILTSNEVNDFYVAYTTALNATLKIGRDKKQLILTK